MTKTIMKSQWNFVEMNKSVDEMPGGKSEKMLTLLASIKKVLCLKTISFDICKLF